MSEVTFRGYEPGDAEIIPGLFIDALREVYPDISGGEWTSDLDHVPESYLQDGGDFLVGVDGRIVWQWVDYIESTLQLPK